MPSLSKHGPVLPAGKGKQGFDRLSPNGLVESTCTTPGGLEEEWLSYTCPK
jgi:hypothetical protein